MKKRILILIGIMLGSIFLYTAFISEKREITNLTDTMVEFPQLPKTGSVNITADADVFTQKTMASNFNVYDDDFLRLGLYEFTYDSGGYISEMYLRFNLPQIENIGSMVLQLTYYAGYPVEVDSNYEVNASLVSNDWIEGNTVWTERPDYLGTSTLVYLDNPSLESEVFIDLTSLVEGITETTITIHLCPNNLSRIRFPAPFYSSESYGITPKLILQREYEFEWIKTWGGIYNDKINSGTTMAIDSFDNIYLVGEIDSTGTSNYDIVLIKCDSQGVEQWVKIWDDGGSEWSNSILIDNLNEIYVVGQTTNYDDPDGDMLIIKYDSDGNQLWNFTWGGTEFDMARVIVKDSLNNYYIAGETRSFADPDGDVILIKFDSNWIEQWNVSWGGTEKDYPSDMQIDSNGHVCIVGDSYSADPSPGEADIMVLKYDASGTLIWDEEWGASLNQRGRGIAIDSNNNIYIGGYTFGNPALSMKGILVKYDNNGNYQWERIWGVDGVYGNSWWDLTIDFNNEIFICGYTSTHGPYAGEGDVIFLNYDISGNQNWYETWGMPDFENAICIEMDSKHNIYLAGVTDSLGAGGDDIFLMKYLKILGRDIQSPIIDFNISDEYLNSTRPLETDLGLQINCSLSDDSTIDWTYLCDNSTGTFVNRSMVLSVDGSWSYNLDISSLYEDDLLMFSFMAKDSYNNIGVLNNVGQNFSILIGDYYRGPIHISSDNDFTIQNGVRDPWVEGTKNDPYIIEGWIIDTGGFGSGIFIENTTKSFKIENCILTNSGSNINDAGIRFYNVSNGKIINNNVSNNGWTGIRLLKSIKNIISYNMANNNSDMGIYLRDGSNNNSVTNNICNNNSQWGIELNINSDGNLITGNIVNYNDKVGIQINSGCDLNLIYSNIIVGNIQNNANDDGSSNNWDNGTIGNYWGDYESNYPNAWNDGFFWDTAYLIPGSTTSYDYHPTDNFLEEDPQYFNFTTSLMTYSSGGLYKFNCTWIDDDNAVSEVYLKFNGTFYLVNKNFTGEFSFTFEDLPANENGYEYQWLAKDQFNAWNVTPTNYFVLLKMNVALSLKFNGTEGDYVSRMNNYVNISLSNLDYTDGELQIFINNTLIASGSTLLINNLSYYQIPGIYNITGLLTHQNYTGEITYWMTINEIFPPTIIFDISPLHLNTTTPQYNERLRISCTVNDDSPITWVYLCENSTGSFVNRSMSFINGNYTITLDLQLVNWSDTVTFSFYASDSIGNLRWENNGGLNYTIQIYDFDSPITSILFELYFDPYYINKSIYFSLAAEDYIEFGSAGVNVTFYKIDNGIWEFYNSPFNLSEYHDGFHNISYYSSDIAGNIENPNILEIYLITEESDIDGDGLNHYDEINIYLTDPFDSDSDDDGLTDDEEVLTYSTNPNLEDTDEDRLTDGEEVHNYNTNPLSRDTDGDGYSDYDEIITYRTDPNNAFSSLTMTVIISLIIFFAISILSFIGVKKGKTIHRKRIEKKVIIQILEDKNKVLDCNTLNNKLQKVKSCIDFEMTLKERNINGQYIQNRAFFVKNIGIEKLSAIIKEILNEIHIQNLSKQERGKLFKINFTDLEQDERILEFIRDLSVRG